MSINNLTRPSGFNVARRPWIVLLVFCTLFASACSRPASQSPVVNTTERTPTVTVDQVKVTQGSGVYVHGQSMLPVGDCVQTELLADNKPVIWWPRDVCIQEDAGQWEILVALGQNGAPAKLDPKVKYEIHAWWPSQPEKVSTRFPFDLNSPPPP